MTSAPPPLSGLRVLVTRPVDQASALVAALEAAGAVPVRYPTIRIAPPPSWDPLDQALARGDDAYDWVVFTSAAAVRHTLGRPNADVCARLAAAAVGRETARALTAASLRVDVAPPPADERQEGLAAALAGLPPGTRILFPQALGGRPWLAADLRSRGCMVDVVPAYETIPVVHASPPPPYDAATFASPSALRVFVDAAGAQGLAAAIVAVIGPTTHALADELGVRVDVVAHEPGAAALVDALADHILAASTHKGAR